MPPKGSTTRVIVPPDAASRERQIVPIRQPLPVYTSLELPGQVVSIDKAVECLGGLYALTQSLDKYEQARAASQSKPDGEDDEAEEEEQRERDVSAEPAAAKKKKKAAASTTAPTKVHVLPVMLSLAPGHASRHPVEGTTQDAAGLLLKVIKRKRKRATPEDSQVGIYTVEVAGLVDKFVRFRSMCDFQYEPDIRDRITDLAEGVRSMDVDKITDFDWTTPSDDFDPLEFLPPPTFSSTQYPHFWNFSANKATIPEEAIRFDGTTYERLRNGVRRKAKLLVSIAHDDLGRVPSKPLPDETPAGTPKQRRTRGAKQKGKGKNKGKGRARDSDADEDDEEEDGDGEGNDGEDTSELPPYELAEDEGLNLEEKDRQILEKLRRLLLKRPMWTRAGLLNQLSDDQRRRVTNNKAILADAGYTFSSGPFKDMVIQFGWDPRLEPEAARLQRIQVRNVEHTRERGQTGIADQMVPGGELSKSHTFDGKKAHTQVGTFQICDITDPLFVERSEEPNARLDHCSPSVDGFGWWDDTWFELLRAILKIKFRAAVKGQPIMDDKELDEHDVYLRKGDPSSVPHTERAGTGSGGRRGSASGSTSSDSDAVAAALAPGKKRYFARKAGPKKSGVKQKSRAAQGANSRIKQKLAGDHQGVGASSSRQAQFASEHEENDEDGDEQMHAPSNEEDDRV